MKTRLLFAAVWTATTVAGATVSWFGVGDALRGTALAVPDVAASAPVRQGRPPEPAPAESAPQSAEKVRPEPPARSPHPTATPAASQSPPSRAPSRPGEEIRTYVVKSGRVVLALTPTSARLVSATPDPGSHVRQWRRDGWLRIDLTNDTHGSAVIAVWHDRPTNVEIYEY
ncbi:hypothetical protein [Actinomadura flavalba]|uniref:hypothetical protein n=1 Tax=Actinomadura flavalba TaxID=1120938 RepID=UPI00037F57AE|nr:hypothetical protein [Actinomadura flavalba]